MSDKSTDLGNHNEVYSDKKESQSGRIGNKVGIGETNTQENESITDKISEKTTESLSDVKKEGKKGIKKLFSCEGELSDIKSITLGLFALIGFIILVYSIFVATVGDSLAAIADTVFIAALIGSFTLVGTIISHLYTKK
jgi:hypothetical protein